MPYNVGECRRMAVVRVFVEYPNGEIHEAYHCMCLLSVEQSRANVHKVSRGRIKQNTLRYTFCAQNQRLQSNKNVDRTTFDYASECEKRKYVK